MTNMAEIPVDSKKTLDIFVSGTNGPMTLKLDIWHTFLSYTVPSLCNNDLRLTLTSVMAR